MPIYEYICESCNATSDVLQKVDDPPPEKCEACGATGTQKKVVSRTSFVLKGGGWYADLYGSPKKGSGEKASSAADSGGAKESSGAGAKSDTKSEKAS